MELDDVLLTLGAYGRYQIVVYMFISVFDNFPSIWHMSVMAFLGYEPKHHCKVRFFTYYLFDTKIKSLRLC